MSAGNIKVVVRCRPLNQRELNRGARCLIRMEGPQTILEPPIELNGSLSRAAGKKPHVYSFDKSYWSAGSREDPDYASQETLYGDLGVELLDHSLQGFNTCILAYGQTGSGKSYSMMGYGSDKGIIPLTTSELFRRIDSRSKADAGLSFTVEVSYMEIYNEKVRDLLNPKNKGNLRVREHPSLGPYVEDLCRLVVENNGQMMTLMDEGNKARTIASTNMNETSSRSHAVFTVILTQKKRDAQTGMMGEKVSKISLVDLAGSERQALTGATGTRLKEGANINKSLTTLGKVIAALARASSDPVNGKKKKDDFVPYRDSALTWLLKESLGGNSKTAMIAAISPADYEETLSTLRYANAAKQIKTHAVINEDPNAKLIRELKEELEILRTKVSGQAATDQATDGSVIPPEKQIITYQTKDGEIRNVTRLELQDQLQASEKLMESLNMTWEEKMVKTHAIQLERERALEELGITIDKDVVGVHAPQKHPSLVNLNEDPLMSECLVYQIKPGTTIAGSVDSDSAQIKLSGFHILDEHCIITNEEGIVSLEAMPDARTFVNGKRVPPNSPVRLLNGYRVILGDFHVFRFNDPASARAQRRRSQANAGTTETENFPEAHSDTPLPGDDFMDWSAARREVADIEKLGDQDLDRLFDDIVKVRSQRQRPESRGDLATELGSRFLTASNTEEHLDSLPDPWGGPLGTTLTTDSLGTPMAREVSDDAVVNVEPEADVENLAAASSSNVRNKEETSLEQDLMFRQLQSLAQELRRTRNEAAAARVLERDVPEVASWTIKELKLVREAIKRWKRLRWFALAEELLKGCRDLKEANIIAREMGSDVTYNHTIVDSAHTASRSTLEVTSGLIDVENPQEPSRQSCPAVVVKALDREANSVYVCDMPKFKIQLKKMRHLRSMQSRPGYSLHFRTDGTFTDDPASSYSLVGTTTVPLALLAKRMSYTVSVPIMCPYTMEAIGSCRASFDCVDSAHHGCVLPDSVDEALETRLATEKPFTFSLTISGVRGCSSSDFSDVHIQTRLSTLLASDVAHEEVIASLPVNLDRSPCSHLSVKRTLNVVVTSAMAEGMRDNYAKFEFFAHVKPQYLDRLERWDRQREVTPLASSLGVSPITEPASRTAELSKHRREMESIGSEHHDILANIEIKELASDGEYQAADVIDDVYQLHQGLQRRVDIQLTHTSGRSFPWTGVEHLTISNIRLIDKGQVSSMNETKSQARFRLSGQKVEYLPDGSSTLKAGGVWDSAMHDCAYLDKRTRSQQVVLIHLSFLLQADGLAEPAVFDIDLSLRILGREARRSSLLTMFTAKPRNCITVIYSLDLKPRLARSSSDLWRLDTSGQYVKGQEILGDWRPRRLSLLEDFRRMRKAERSLADVQVTKAVMALQDRDECGDPRANDIRTRSEEERLELVRRCIELWRNAIDQRIEVNFKSDSPQEAAMRRKLEKHLPDLGPKWHPTVKLQPMAGIALRVGYLYLLRDPQADVWERVYCVLKRPYILVQRRPDDEGLFVINVTRATVTPSLDVEVLLGRKYAFTIFTTTNSFMLQAESRREMDEWIAMIATLGD